MPEADERLDAVAALIAADGRTGAEAIWEAAVGTAVALRRALGAAAGDERPVRADDVIEEFFAAALRELPDARAALVVVASADIPLAVQAPTTWHREVVAGLAGEGDPERWREGLRRWAADEPAEESAALLQELGVPAFAAPSNWANADAPSARGAFPPHRDGFAPRPPPASASLPLGDVVAIELGGLWAAPFATKLLGDLGARVVKVEAPSRPDGTRAGSMAQFRALNEGKEIVRLDLRRDDDRERLLAELGPRTVVIENNTGRVLPNLGMPPEAILARGAALVRLPASRLRPDWRGLGSTTELAAGLGREGEDGLTCAPIPLTDPLAGATAALAALAALGGEPRLHTIGQLEDVALPFAAAAGGAA